MNEKFPSPDTHELPPELAATANRLTDLAKHIQPEVAFLNRLQTRLENWQPQRPLPRLLFSQRFIWALAGAAALALLLVLVAPLVLPAASPAGLPRLLRLDAAAVNAAPLNPVVFTGAEWVLQTDLPQTRQAEVYRQLPVQPEVTEADARRLAEQLGIQGEPRSRVNEGGRRLYTIADDHGEMSLVDISPYTFISTIRASSLFSGRDLSSFEQQAQFAVDWLKARGLLNFEYRVAPIRRDPYQPYYQPFKVAIIQKLPGGFLYTSRNSGNSPRIQPRITMNFDPDQSRIYLYYQRVETSQVGSYPLRPAEEVWQTLVGGKLADAIITLYQNEPSCISGDGFVPPCGNWTVADRDQAPQVVVERVELVYYTSSFEGTSWRPAADHPALLVQPMWLFSGYLTDRPWRFDILVQAVTEEYLLP